MVFSLSTYFETHASTIEIPKIFPSSLGLNPLRFAKMPKEKKVKPSAEEEREEQQPAKKRGKVDAQASLVRELVARVLQQLEEDSETTDTEVQMDGGLSVKLQLVPREEDDTGFNVSVKVQEGFGCEDFGGLKIEILKKS